MYVCVYVCTYLACVRVAPVNTRPQRRQMVWLDPRVRGSLESGRKYVDIMQVLVGLVAICLSGMHTGLVTWDVHRRSCKSAAREALPQKQHAAAHPAAF